MTNLTDENDSPTDSDNSNFSDSDLNKTKNEKHEESDARTEKQLMTKTRSPLWYELPLIFIVIGGIIAYLKIRKDDPRKARNCLILGITLTVPFAIIVSIFGFTGLFLGLTTDNPFYVISSGSMEPNLHIFDVVTVDRNFPFNDLKVGDIIAFNRPIVHDKSIVHRVVEILKDNPLTLRTQGDANPGSIPGTDFPVTEQDYIGKVVKVTPQVGYMTRILSPPVGNIINAVKVIVLIVPIIQHVRYKKSSKTQT